MKSFKLFILEGGVSPVVDVDNTKVDLKKMATKLEINRNLVAVFAQEFTNPYAGYVKAAKVLRNYGMELPRFTFMDKSNGHEIFCVNTFGGFVGANLDGSVTPPGSHDYKTEHYFFFSYRVSENGFYKCSGVIVDEDQLGEFEAPEGVITRGQLDPRQPK